MLKHHSTSEIALLFPGQGEQAVNMLEGLKDTVEFSEYYSLIVETLGISPLEQLASGNKDYLHQNLVSSLLTVLTSSICLKRYIQKYGSGVHSLAGYSVGQWTALYAAGVVSFKQLIQILKKRCELMDACFNKNGGAMLGVIGVKEHDLANFCQEIEQTNGGFIGISNYNSLGQYSVAGSVDSIHLALEKIEKLRPRKAILLPVSGAWHCALLQPAAEQFARYLAEVELSQATIPIIDNVTGEYLPTDMDQLKLQLTKHLSNPVRWMDGIRFLSSRGCKKMIEVGYGKMLTKFGFFIDFNLTHESFYA